MLRISILLDRKLLDEGLLFETVHAIMNWCLVCIMELGKESEMEGAEMEDTRIEDTGIEIIEIEDTGMADTGKKSEKNTKRKYWKIILVVALVLIISLLITGYAIFHHYYSLLDFHDPQQESSMMENSGLGEPVTWEDLEGDEGEDDEIYGSSVDSLTEEEVNQVEQDLIQNIENMDGLDLYATDAINILLIGVDSRSNSFSGRSDSMILVSINQKRKEVTMTSLLRDIYVSIPGRSSNRLNAAYAYGGMSLLADTIKANFGITVDNCVVVNFFLVKDIVDEVGGIDLEVSADEIRVMNGYIKEHNRLLGNAEGTDILSESAAGTIHANGSQALAYARVRYVGTDFARTGRQRTVISKCLDKIKTMNLAELSAMAEKFLPRVRTNLTEGDCASLLLMALGLSDYSIQNMTIPADGTWSNARIRGMSVLNVDFAANAKAWHKLVEGEE